MKRSRLTVATAAACLGLALLFSGCTNDDDSASQTPSPTAEPTAPDAPSTMLSVFEGSEPPVEVTYTLPDGWVGEGPPQGAHSEYSTVTFWDVHNVYADGCKWTLLDPPLGPTVDDLATVWAGLPGFTSTAPVDITVDGYTGKRVEYTLPDYNAPPACGVEGKFALWTVDDGTQLEPNFWGQGPLRQNRQWIIDVDGTRLVINEWHKPGTTPDQLAEMDQLVASIQIG